MIEVFLEPSKTQQLALDTKTKRPIQYNEMQKLPTAQCIDEIDNYIMARNDALFAGKNYLFTNPNLWWVEGPKAHLTSQQPAGAGRVCVCGGGGRGGGGGSCPFCDLVFFFLCW